MLKRLGFYGLIALLAVALLTMGGCGQEEASDPSTGDFPDLVSHRVHLRSADNEEILRVAVHNEAGDKISEQIQHKNGVTTILHFRPDQTVSEELDYYPSEDGEPKQLKTHIFLMDDGINFERHTIFRPDGSMEKSGHRLADGSYTTLHFRLDGASIAKQVIFSEHRLLMSELIYHGDGKIWKKTDRVNGRLVTAYFREDGSREYDVAEGFYGTIEGAFYSEDGSTEVAKFKRSSYDLTLTIFPDDESISKVEISYSYSSRNYKVFGTNGKVRYMQKWKLVGGELNCDSKGTYVLDEVTEFHGENFSGQYNWSDNLEIEMNEDGTHPVKLVVEKGNNKTIEIDFHADGSVKRIREYDDQEKLTADNEFEPGVMQSPISIPEDLVKFHETACYPVPDKVE